MARKKLGELLIERGIIDDDQLRSALAYQRHWGHRLGTALVAKGFVTEAQICQVLGAELGIPVFDLSELQPDADAIALLTANFCETHEVFPVALDDSRGRKRLVCAMADPLNMAAVDEMEFTTGCKARPVLAPVSQIHSAIRRYYRHRNTDIKKVPERPLRSPDSEMVLVRPGGGEVMVDTRVKTDPGAAPRPPDVLLLTEEVTQRTALAEIMREREERLRQSGKSKEAVKEDLDFLFGVNPQDTDRLDKLERRFWSLMRLLAKKGLLDQQEFLDEIDRED